MPQKDQTSELTADIREQILYLQELGIEGLNADISVRQPGVQHPESIDPPMIEDFVASPRAEMPKVQDKKPSRLSALPSLSKRTPYASQNGSIEILKQEAEPLRQENEPMTTDALFDIGPALPESSETIEGVRADIGDCTRCPLHAGRTQVVHSTGNLNADLMFVGEAPGADEDAQGFPFVGRAGQLLTKIIESIGFKREEVFIGNINRCRPPGNRQPTLQEAHTCRPFLLREVAVVRPKVIVVLGNTALHNLLDTKVGITKIRGQFQDYFGVKVMPTFHPAFLLRDPNKKREVWEDMKKVRDYLKSAT
jgi:uracil-DNA glycosylase family 4